MPRRRRNWPFVLLFPAVGASDDDSARGFLGTYTDLVRQRGSSPVMVLTAVVGPPPSYVTVVDGESDLEEVADDLQSALVRRRRATEDSEGRYVRLPADSTERAARGWLRTNRKGDAASDTGCAQAGGPRWSPRYG